MALSPQQELVWQGHLHLGDEPGVYGDAAYCGLAAELPLTVQRADPADRSHTEFLLTLDTEALETFAGFPGHSVIVMSYEADPADPTHFIERPIANTVFTGADNNHKEIAVDVGSGPGPFRLSVLFRCDTTVPPGLYDDFVWLRLSLLADDFAFVASLGFTA